MTRPDIEKAALALPAAERMALADHLWRSIAATDAPVSDQEKRLLDDRLAEHTAQPGDVVSWDEIKADLWPDIPRCGKLPPLFPQTPNTPRPPV